MRLYLRDYKSVSIDTLAISSPKLLHSNGFPKCFNNNWLWPIIPILVHRRLTWNQRTYRIYWWLSLRGREFLKPCFISPEWSLSLEFGLPTAAAAVAECGLVTWPVTSAADGLELEQVRNFLAWLGMRWVGQNCNFQVWPSLMASCLSAPLFTNHADMDNVKLIVN